MDISKIDKNFAVNCSLRKENVKVFRAGEKNFDVYGLMLPDETDAKFHRLPESVAKSVNAGVHWLYADTAGGRLRFATDSDYIGIYAVAPRVGRMSHFALSGSAGFDLYRTENGVQTYQFTVMPPFDIKDNTGFSGEISYSEKTFHEYTLNFPLYSRISELYIILDENANVYKPAEYKIKTPLVYYGSSITQGGCASRPGNTYQAILSRRFDCDYINLGFSGNARGELEIAEYIASLDMTAFVYDYDHNAPDWEHLKDTHERMFKIIRKAKPMIPIICMSSPTPLPDGEQRRNVIRTTVENARKNGDENAFFVNGCDCSKVLGAGDCVSVDGCHPNDLGFFCMAQLLEEVFRKIF